MDYLEDAASRSALAPHPITFSIDGGPASTAFKLDGKKYRVDWDGHQLRMTEYSRKFGVWHTHAVEPDFDFDDYNFNSGCSGCLILLFAIVLFWGSVVYAINKYL